MRAFRSLVQRPLLSSSLLPLRTRQASSGLFRWQQRSNNNYGPHKEYFQTPGQAPLPDSTPYDPSQPIEIASTDTAPSRIAGAFKGLLWAFLFLQIGIGTGVAFVTWEYLQPPYEPGSPEEQDLLEEIEELLDTHPVVLGLREQGYTEEDFYARRALSDRDKGQNFIHETLRGSSQTLKVKAFKNISQQNSFLVFFVGFGLDGFPDVMHGGITASMILEAINRHLAIYCSDLVLDGEKSSINIDYKSPVRPGEIYTIMVAPGTLEPDAKDHSKSVVRLAALLLRLESPPQLSRSWDSKTNTLVHKVEIHSSSRDTPYMATADITVPVVPRAKPVAFKEPPTFKLPDLTVRDPNKSPGDPQP